MTAPHLPEWPAWVNEDRENERLFREAEQGISVYRIQCAAITNGCPSAIVFEGDRNIDVEQLDPLVWSDRRAASLLALNSWHLDHGRWVCGAHTAASALAEEMAP